MNLVNINNQLYGGFKMEFTEKTGTLMWQFIVSLSVAFVLAPILNVSLIGKIWMAFIVFWPIILYVMYIYNSGVFRNGK